MTHIFDNIDPRWRTSSVMDMAQAVLDTQDSTRLPILADALMDAGCDDDVLLRACQGPTLPVDSAVRIAALIVGGEYAAAVDNIEYTAKELGDADSVQEGGKYDGRGEMTYDRLMWMAGKIVDNKEDEFTEYGGEHWQTVSMGPFWRAYELLMKRLPEEPKNFFGCAC